MDKVQTSDVIVLIQIIMVQKLKLTLNQKQAILELKWDGMLMKPQRKMSAS